ncbi:hypothetical protein [Paenibacillus sp. sgz500992]|uniref:hypothetical protein n=1 Tax=Paenibacillus sp. sgz500992 TaxID=3242476 RepID=UPI0036D33D1A
MGGGDFSSLPSNSCDSTPSFLVIVNENQDVISFSCEVEQEVHLEYSKAEGSYFPTILVKRTSDDLLIGLVPPSHVWIIKCLEEGWEYRGKIRRVIDPGPDPKISVIFRGVKK